MHHVSEFKPTVLVIETNLLKMFLFILGAWHMQLNISTSDTVAHLSPAMYSFQTTPLQAEHICQVRNKTTPIKYFIPTVNRYHGYYTSIRP